MREAAKSNHGWGFQYDVEAPSMINKREGGAPLLALMVQTILLCVPRSVCDCFPSLLIFVCRFVFERTPMREAARSSQGSGFQYYVEAPPVINRREEAAPLLALMVQTIWLCVTVFRFCWFSFLDVFVSSAAILTISSDPIASK